MYIGGLDVGTTGCKLTVYNEYGELIQNFYREYEINRRFGKHEINAENIFDAVCSMLCEGAAQYEIDAVGVSTFGETFVMLDCDDKVLLPSVLYTDPRGGEECKALCEAIGEDAITKICGAKSHQMYSLPKLMWIKNNLPETFKKAKRVLLMEDYIVYMLTGNTFIDYSLAARTMAFDIRNKCWSDEILSAAGIDKELLSVPVPPAHAAGEIKAELARELGIKNSIKIVNAAHDQVAAAVGAGVLENGQAMDGTGTVECIVPVFDRIPENEQLYREGYSAVPFAIDGMYACYALSYTGGAAIKWFRDKISAEKSYKVLDDAVSEKPTGILVMPHFAGGANPYMDIESRAAFLGLTLEHTSADLYKALMEGVTYEMMINVTHLESFGIVPERLYATGGGASGDIWLQIKADILNRPVTALYAKEAGACGTCMLTCLALGIYKDLHEAKKYFVKERKTFLPKPENREIYNKYFNAYKKIYGAVRPIIEEINFLEE